MSVEERNDTNIFISCENYLYITIGYVYIYNINIGGTEFRHFA